MPTRTRVAAVALSVSFAAIGAASWMQAVPGSHQVAGTATGGASGFNVLFGGGRAGDGQYARLEAHGFFWTATESGPTSAWLYNFGGARFVNRHSDGETPRAFSVRCIRD